MCPACGRPVPVDAPQGLCPACLLGAGLPGDSTRDHVPAEAWPSTAAAVGTTDASWATRTTATRPEGGEIAAIPGYQMLDLLGQGGMGVVYRAVQIGLNRQVALKTIRGDARFQKDQFERFRIEAEAVARLRHPNVVQIFEIGEAGGLPYFSLELLTGGTLAARLRQAPMTPTEAARVLASLARGVQAAHQAGIVHRDLKPSNVLFDADGTPKVADFGLAKRLEADDGQTHTGQVMGTPSYMAPEQARGENRGVGPAADIYALGAILYEAITGRPPFRGASASETVLLVITADPVSPTRLQPRLPRDLETICLKCLAKDPARRYGSAEALADDLARFLDGRSILARPAPSWEKAAKWAKRRPIASGLAIASVAAVAVVIGAVEQSRSAREALGQLKNDQVVRELNNALTALDTSRKQPPASARDTLGALLRRLDRAEPRFAEVRGRAEEELRDVDRTIARDEARARVARDFERFRTLRDRAILLDGEASLLPDSLFEDDGPTVPRALADDEDRRFPASLLPGDRRPPTRREARTREARTTAGEALAILASGPSAELSDDQAEELRSGRLMVALALSEAVARPLPGEDPKAQARAAIAVLDRVAEQSRRGPAYHLRRAACLRRAGEAGESDRETALAEASAPNDAVDHFLLGQERSRRGDWDGARSQFEAALKLRSNLFWARCLLAVAFLNASPPRPVEARAELSIALDDHPDFAWLYLIRGAADGQLGSVLAASARVARPADSSRLKAEAAGRFAEAEDDFRRASELGLDRDLEYVLRMNRGALRFQRGRLDDALADFLAAIPLSGGRYNPHASLAMTYRKLGKPDEAVEELGRALALEPRLAALYRGRALARLDRTDVSTEAAEEAIADLETSASLEGSARNAATDQAFRARLLLKLDRPEQALAASESALKAAPDHPYARLVRLYALLDLERFSDVLAACDAMAKEEAPSPDLLRLRAVAKLARKDFAGAIEDASRALALQPGWAPALRNRGWAYLFSGASELSWRDFNEAIAAEPRSAEGFSGRASANLLLGRIREAISDSEFALKAAEPTARTFYAAARIYAGAAASTASEAAPRAGSTSSATPRRSRPAPRPS